MREEINTMKNENEQIWTDEELEEMALEAEYQRAMELGNKLW
jgi:hypothetical protein